MHGRGKLDLMTFKSGISNLFSFDSCMGTAVHMLDDIHGGAGQQFLSLLLNLAAEPDLSANKIANYLTRYRQDINPYIPGFGHRFHKPVDPRAPRLIALLRAARDRGDVSGEFVEIALQIETVLADLKGKPVPMNIDGATAVIYGELGFPPELARGLFCLSRSVGAMAHGYEQMEQGGRNKGPTPPHYRWHYEKD